MIAYLLIFAAAILLGGWAMDAIERRAAAKDFEARIDAYFDDPAAIAARIHAQMVADGLTRDPDARQRATDEVSA